MERVSVEERIKRAEERYYKTKDKTYEKEEENSVKVKKESNNKMKKRIYKKLITNICICLIIYGCFYQITTNQSMFSEDFKNKAKEILNKDINFIQLFSVMKKNVNNFFTQLEQNSNNLTNSTEDNSNNGTEDNQNSNGTENNTNNENSTNVSENIQNNNENIGGAIETENNSEGIQQNTDTTVENSNDQTENDEETVELSQMEKDANYVKENISIIKPVNGTISSKYGLRNPTTPTVPKNHKGTDIAAVVGTKIISATDGKVVLKSTEGDYGKHLKIQIGEVELIYAHCNDLYVNEGDEVKQGQEIAEVGSTGNTTGPHLHFEIRYQNRCVDPEMILSLS